FFFQAEDGIRDGHVTGVQTCALPIFSRHTIWGSNRVYTETHGPVETFVDWLNDMLGGSATWSNVTCSDCSLLGSCNGGSNDGARSEERRVGKECRTGVSTDAEKKSRR